VIRKYIIRERVQRTKSYLLIRFISYISSNSSSNKQLSQKSINEQLTYWNSSLCGMTQYVTYPRDEIQVVNQCIKRVKSIIRIYTVEEHGSTGLNK